MWIVYNELFTDGRWYYGKYSDRNTANEVAMELNELTGKRTFCVIEDKFADDFNIQNMPL